MKRFLNNIKEIDIIQVVGKPFKFTLNGVFSLSDNELVIGKDSFGNRLGLFVYKSTDSGLYSLSFDDFAYSFLSAENSRLLAAFENLTTSLSSLSTPPTIPDESGE